MKKPPAGTEPRKGFFRSDITILAYNLYMSRSYPRAYENENNNRKNFQFFKNI